MLGARLKYALGQKIARFTCPNCGANNQITEDEFHSYEGPQNVVPVTATLMRPGHGKDSPTEIGETREQAPTNPVEAPKPAKYDRRAVVRVRGVDARRDHNDWAEIMGAFSKGEKLTPVDTWTDGESTWVQVGPERWVNVEQGGEPVLDLID
jgi:hypothetical protein